MVKAKFFLGDTISKIEKEVNDFINSDKINMIDLKIATGIGQVVCVVTYNESA